jgi:hypothetical protein
MKTRLLEYFEAARNRRELRMRKCWHLIRRIGQGWFITSGIAGFWLSMAPVFFYMAWSLDPSLKVLHRLRPEFYSELLFLVPSFSVILYFGLRYAWRENERKYPNDRNK